MTSDIFILLKGKGSQSSKSSAIFNLTAISVADTFMEYTKIGSQSVYVKRVDRCE